MSNVYIRQLLLPKQRGASDRRSSQANFDDEPYNVWPSLDFESLGCRSETTTLLFDHDDFETLRHAERTRKGPAGRRSRHTNVSTNGRWMLNVEFTFTYSDIVERITDRPLWPSCYCANDDWQLQKNNEILRDEEVAHHRMVMVAARRTSHGEW